jgi:hypothetical protein
VEYPRGLADGELHATETREQAIEEAEDRHLERWREVVVCRGLR